MLLLCPVVQAIRVGVGDPRAGAAIELRRIDQAVPVGVRLRGVGVDRVDRGGRVRWASNRAGVYSLTDFGAILDPVIVGVTLCQVGNVGTPVGAVDRPFGAVGQTVLIGVLSGVGVPARLLANLAEDLRQLVGRGDRVVLAAGARRDALQQRGVDVGAQPDRVEVIPASFAFVVSAGS